MAEEKITECPCKRIQCERHGDCTACREYHLLNKRYAPACDRILQRAQRRASRRNDLKQN